MKKLKTVLTGAALVLLSGAVMATGNLKVNIVPAGKDKATVYVSNVIETMYEIELKNEKGDVVFYKHTDAPSNGYSKQFNFTFLDDGDYRLSIKTGNEKLVNTLNIDNGQVKPILQRREAKPYFTVNNNLLELSYLNFELENLKVMLFYNNTLIYETYLKPEFTINYGLDISRLNSGNYNAVLETGTGSFEYELVKK